MVSDVKLGENSWCKAKYVIGWHITEILALLKHKMVLSRELVHINFTVAASNNLDIMSVDI